MSTEYLSMYRTGRWGGVSLEGVDLGMLNGQPLMAPGRAPDCHPVLALSRVPRKAWHSSWPRGGKPKRRLGRRTP